MIAGTRALKVCLECSGESSFPRHMLSTKHISKVSAEAIFEAADYAHLWVNSRKDQVHVNLFHEPSTRTRVSFELAAKKLGMNVVNVNATESSSVKGETLLDTVKNLEALGANTVAIRTNEEGVLGDIAWCSSCLIVNAGDGTNEHPTQALLDAYTLRQKWGTLEGKIIAVCGDLEHSRVARSNYHLLKTLGAEVRLAEPLFVAYRQPMLFEEVRPFDSIEHAIEGADAVMVLRIQHERWNARGGGSAYLQACGLTKERLALAKPGAVVLHPGPINRGIEIDSEIADGPHSLVLQQVKNGLAVRMAILWLLTQRLTPRA